MRYAMPLYEVKYNGNDVCEDISDIKIMEKLYKHFDRVTPAIKELINGKEFLIFSYGN